jgi:hypothetical protein
MARRLKMAASISQVRREIEETLQALCNEWTLAGRKIAPAVEGDGPGGAGESNGRFYADVAPVKGLYLGGATSEVMASVTMTRLDPQAGARA